MCTTSTAKRRRKQMVSNYSHLPRSQRPNYRRRDASAASKHLSRLIANERKMQQKKK